MLAAGSRPEAYGTLGDKVFQTYAFEGRETFEQALVSRCGYL
jgi:hypothetical protein